MSEARPLPEAAESDLVAAFLRANPAWLADHPELYHLLAPPRRIHGEVLADHMAALLYAARSHTTAVIDAGRAAAGMAGRVQTAVLALIRARDPVDCIVAEMPGLLGLDAIALCIEALCVEAAGTEATAPGCHALPPRTVARLLDGRDVVFRDAPSDAPLLHAEAARLARHDALVRVPGEGPPALLALASRDARALDPAQGAGALGFLGRAVAAALGR
jgi:uncharacterized protein YigA (DUF484 family)